MDQNESLFDLHVDHEAGIYLKEIARWGKFLSIVGFVMCALLALLGIFAGSVFASLNTLEGTGFPTGIFTAIYIVFALLWFFPFLYLFNFSTKLQVAMRSNDQMNLNEGLKNLKSCFKFMGIMTIILLGLYALVFLVGIAASIGSGF